MNKLLILTLFIFSSSLLRAQEACVQFPDIESRKMSQLEWAKEAQYIQNEASHLVMAAYQDTSFKTTEAKSDLKKLLKRFGFLKKHIETFGYSLTPIDLQVLIANYFLSLKQFIQLELYMDGETQFLSPLFHIHMSRESFYHTHFTLSELSAGILISENSKFVTFSLNGSSITNAIVKYTARSSYLETAKCLLAKVMVEKSVHNAALLGTKPLTEELLELNACGPTKYKDLIGMAGETKLYDRQKNLNIPTVDNKDLLTELITAAQSAEKDPTTYLILLSQQEEGELAQLLLDEAEKLIAEDVFLQSVYQAAKEVSEALVSSYTKCTDVNMQYVDNILKNLIAYGLSNQMRESPALLITKKDEDLKTSLNLSLQAHTYALIEKAVGYELLRLGHISLDNLPEYELQIRSKVKKELKLKLSELSVPYKEKPTSLLKDFPKLITAAKKMSLYMDPKTPLSELPYDLDAITSLFQGTISHLPGDYAFYVNNMISREDFATAQESWAIFQEEIQQDMKAKSYPCKDPLNPFAGNSMKNQLARACAFIYRFVSHIGLDQESMPKTFDQVWPSFEKHYSELIALGDSNLEIFERRYRERLKTSSANIFAVLDHPLRKIDRDADGRIFNQPTEENIRKGIEYSQQNLTSNMIIISESNKISDLDPFIEETTILNELLGKSYYDQFLPSGITPISALSPLTSRVYEQHKDYQDTLIKNKFIDNEIKQQALHTLITPLYYLGGAWVARGILISTKGLKGLGAMMVSGSASTAILTNGYFNMLTGVFAGATYESYRWHLDIGTHRKSLDFLKESESINLGTPKLIDYDHYLTGMHDYKEKQREARFQMVLNGALTVLSTGSFLLDPYIKARAALNNKAPAYTQTSNAGLFTKQWNRFKSSEFANNWMLRGAKNDLTRIRGARSELNHPPNLDLSTLQAARNQLNTPKANEAYRRIIDILGSRIQSAAGNAQKEASLSQVYFGNTRSVAELNKILDEFKNIFDPLARGGL